MYRKKTAHFGGYKTLHGDYVAASLGFLCGTRWSPGPLHTVTWMRRGNEERMSTPNGPTRHWDDPDLDVDGYLARIGYHGPRTPTVATLHALVAAHTFAIPFENFDPLLDRPVRLDVPSLQEKLVGNSRGGYCYENVVLFGAVAERFGFGVTGLSARVSMGATAIHPATHALLRITVAGDERVWIVDVGFGFGPSRPYELTDEHGEFSLGGWLFRLERKTGELGDELWVLHHFARDGWVDRYTFTMNPQYPVDFAVGNHFVSTSPRSPFTKRPFIQSFGPKVHHTLDGADLTTEYPDGSSESRILAPDELTEALSQIFGVELCHADSAALRSWLAPASSSPDGAAVGSRQ